MNTHARTHHERQAYGNEIKRETRGFAEAKGTHTDMNTRFEKKTHLTKFTHGVIYSIFVFQFEHFFHTQT